MGGNFQKERGFAALARLVPGSTQPEANRLCWGSVNVAVDSFDIFSSIVPGVAKVQEKAVLRSKRLARKALLKDSTQRGGGCLANKLARMAWAVLAREKHVDPHC
jgi:hypothetical protein